MTSPITLPAQLSQHLRALRRARGLSQEQLGAMLGLSQTRVARIESRPDAISVGQLLSVLSALGARLTLSPTSETTPVPGAALPARRRRPDPKGDW
jgi:HTH-type transcriptional regulator / antitoxin HipB